MAAWTSFVAIGDSFTEGLDDRLPDGTYRGWADLVAHQLASRSPDLRYANLAVRGRLLDAVIAEQVPAVLTMRPQLVSFAAGGNDILRPNVDLRRLHERLDGVIAGLSATAETVVMFSAADTRTILPAPVRRRFEAFTDLVRVVAATHGAVLVELWRDDTFRDVRMWSEDRLHLSARGHGRVASLVLEALGEPYDPQWRQDLPPLPPTSWFAARQADVRWARTHLAPWVRRRLAGRSSGDGVLPKRPELTPLTSPEDEDIVR